MVAVHCDVVGDVGCVDGTVDVVVIDNVVDYGDAVVVTDVAVVVVAFDVVVGDVLVGITVVW